MGMLGYVSCGMEVGGWRLEGEGELRCDGDVEDGVEYGIYWAGDGDRER